MSLAAVSKKWAVLIPYVCIIAISAWRVMCLWLNPLDLFVDESQYWLWGQELAFGYFSKPPLVGWVIRLSTELGQSDNAFWIRLPAILCHGLAGVIISWAACEVWQDPKSAWAGVAYATLPGVSILALFVSTDDVLMLAVAAFILAIAKLQNGHGPAWALALGVALGIGLMAKYAMIYCVVLLVAAHCLSLLAIRSRDFAIVLTAAIALISPNLFWNVSNEFITFRHTSENADWHGVSWNWTGLAGFLLTQVAAFGLVFGPAFVWAATRFWRGAGSERVLIFFCLPIFFAVGVQALVREANGNWAAPAFVAGVILVSIWLLRARPRLFGLGLTLNLAASGAISLSVLWPHQVSLNGKSVYARVLGKNDLNVELSKLLDHHDLDTVIAKERATLASLVYFFRDSDVSVYALHESGPPSNYYAMTRPAELGSFPALLVLEDERSFRQLEELVTVGNVSIFLAPVQSENHSFVEGVGN